MASAHWPSTCAQSILFFSMRGIKIVCCLAIIFVNSSDGRDESGVTLKDKDKFITDIPFFSHFYSLHPPTLLIWPDTRHHSHVIQHHSPAIGSFTFMEDFISLFCFLICIISLCHTSFFFSIWNHEFVLILLWLEFKTERYLFH